MEWCISDTEDDCAGCPYDGEDGGCHQRNLDALHYLKAFRYAKDTLELEKDRYREAVRNCEEAELKYRKLAQSLGEVGNTEIPPIVSDMSEEEAEAIRKEIVKNAELRRKIGVPHMEGM